MGKTMKIILLFLSFLIPLILFFSCKKPPDTHSITDTAVITHPDSLVVGTWHVQASYVTSGGPNYTDSVLGTTNITITEVSPGTVTFRDDTFTHQQFQISDPGEDSIYPPPYTNYFVMYGNYIQLSPASRDTITIFEGSRGISHSAGYFWTGYKVH
jgi:hypothetical protein